VHLSIKMHPLIKFSFFVNYLLGLHFMKSSTVVKQADNFDDDHWLMIFIFEDPPIPDLHSTRKM
jgi:hypothetical protein